MNVSSVVWMREESTKIDNTCNNYKYSQYSSLHSRTRIDNPVLITNLVDKVIRAFHPIYARKKPCIRTRINELVRIHSSPIHRHAKPYLLLCPSEFQYKLDTPFWTPKNLRQFTPCFHLWHHCLYKRIQMQKNLCPTYVDCSRWRRRICCYCCCSWARNPPAPPDPWLTRGVHHPGHCRTPSTGPRNCRANRLLLLPHLVQSRIEIVSLDSGWRCFFWSQSYDPGPDLVAMVGTAVFWAICLVWQLLHFPPLVDCWIALNFHHDNNWSKKQQQKNLNNPPIYNFKC